MSAAALPPRKQCIHAIGTDYHCQCPWFAPILLDPYICADCGHGIHTHVDYVSMVVSHYPPTRCAAYVQKTPLTQRCTCEAQLCDHVAINNQYRSEELLPNIVDYFTNNDSIPSNNVDATSFSSNAMGNPFIQNFTAFSSNTADENLMPVTPTPTCPNYMDYHTFSSSYDAGNTPLAPAFISSPSASRTSSNTQPGITQTQAYSSEHSFVQGTDQFINNSYIHQPVGDATSGSYEFHDYSNATYGGTPEAWSGSYA